MKLTRPPSLLVAILYDFGILPRQPRLFCLPDAPEFVEADGAASTLSSARLVLKWPQMASTSQGDSASDVEAQTVKYGD